jgi:hypothetical protein
MRAPRIWIVVIYIYIYIYMSCPVLSCPVPVRSLSCPRIHSNVDVRRPFLVSSSCPVLSCPVLSCPVQLLSCPVQPMSCPVLSCPASPPMSCPVPAKSVFCFCFLFRSLPHRIAQLLRVAISPEQTSPTSRTTLSRKTSPTSHPSRTDFAHISPKLPASSKLLLRDVRLPLVAAFQNSVILQVMLE